MSILERHAAMFESLRPPQDTAAPDGTVDIHADLEAQRRRLPA
jgi:hypothetical protein